MLQNLPQINRDKPAWKTTLTEYIRNPVGKGTANVAARKRIADGMNQVFVKLLLNSRNSFTAKVYYVPHDGLFWHVKVPSEEFGSAMVYDVFIYLETLFTLDEMQKLTDDKWFKHLTSGSKARFWSNCPSFIFTYAYVYYHNDVGIPNIAAALLSDDICVRKPPLVRNPQETMGYEKSTYIASRFLHDGRLLDKKFIMKNVVIIPYAGLLKEIDRLPKTDDILKRYRYLQSVEAAKKHREDPPAKNKSVDRYETARKSESRSPKMPVKAKKLAKIVARQPSVGKKITPKRSTKK